MSFDTDKAIAAVSKATLKRVEEAAAAAKQAAENTQKLVLEQIKLEVQRALDMMEHTAREAKTRPAFSNVNVGAELHVGPIVLHVSADVDVEALDGKS